ncbi:hypothetical protein [Pricia mediterranea]|uniref:hypothetical protein n=1 Tax=Pricia mediterranea TaxID=3076079 RepID=UPI003D7813BA
MAREMGVDKSTFYYWRKKFGGMELAHMRRLFLEVNGTKMRKVSVLPRNSCPF